MAPSPAGRRRLAVLGWCAGRVRGGVPGGDAGLAPRAPVAAGSASSGTRRPGTSARPACPFLGRWSRWPGRAAGPGPGARPACGSACASVTGARLLALSPPGARCLLPPPRTNRASSSFPMFPASATRSCGVARLAAARAGAGPLAFGLGPGVCAGRTRGGPAGSAGAQHDPRRPTGSNPRAAGRGGAGGDYVPRPVLVRGVGQALAGFLKGRPVVPPGWSRRTLYALEQIPRTPLCCCQRTARRHRHQRSRRSHRLLSFGLFTSRPPHPESAADAPVSSSCMTSMRRLGSSPEWEPAPDVPLGDGRARASSPAHRSRRLLVHPHPDRPPAPGETRRRRCVAPPMTAIRWVQQDVRRPGELPVLLPPLEVSGRHEHAVDVRADTRRASTRSRRRAAPH